MKDQNQQAKMHIFVRSRLFYSNALYHLLTYLLTSAEFWRFITGQTENRREIYLQ